MTPNTFFRGPRGIEKAILDDCAVQARILNNAGRYRDVLDRFERYAEKALAIGHPGLLHQLGAAGSVLPDTAAHEQALAFLNAAVSSLHPERDTAHLSLVLADLALLYLICGEVDSACHTYVQAQVAAGNDRHLTARLNRMCTQFVPAREATQRLLALIERGQPENPRERACSLNNLGVSLRRERENGRSRQWLLKALQVFREQGGDCSDVPLNNLGCLDADEGQFDQADECFRKARVRIGECSAALLVDSNLAGILFAREQYGECRVELEKLLPRAQSIDDKLYTTILWQNLARVRVTLGEAQSAVDILDRNVEAPFLADDAIFQKARAALRENARQKATGSGREVAAFPELPEARHYWPWIFAPIEIL